MNKITLSMLVLGLFALSGCLDYQEGTAHFGASDIYSPPPGSYDVEYLGAGWFTFWLEVGETDCQYLFYDMYRAASMAQVQCR